MTMKDMHGLGCPRCKIRDQFYEDFNSDTKKNVSYFGIISYINHYLFKSGSYEQSKEELSENGGTCKGSNICFLQLINRWAVRQLVSERIKRKKGLLKHIKKKRKSYIQPPPFYKPEHTGNFTIKKSESFTISPPDDTICSVNLKTSKDVYKCKISKKSPNKKKGECKEPKVGTLKRKRWNWAKLKQSETYEDDLFEERKLKQITIEESSNSGEDKIPTPRWSTKISPRMQSRSPSYEDCYDPTELQTIRKDAEEYQYRRNKRRKILPVCKKGDDSTNQMKEDPVTYKTLEKVRDKLEKLERKDCESEEDYYFSEGEESND